MTNREPTPPTTSSDPATDPRASPFPPVRQVDCGAPLRWVAAGWRDLRAAPGPSLFYGAAFALMGWLIYFVFRHAHQYTSALTAGFLLLGPFLCTGLYDISRQLSTGQPVRLAKTMTAWRANLGAFSLFALILTVVMLVWARVSLVTFALFFSSGMPSLSGFLGRVASVEHLDFVLTYFAVGAVFAVIVFALSVVSVPLMLARGTDTVVAAITSVRALAANPLPLALWAALIVLLVGAGFATLFFGLLIAVPVVGHATWHVYRDLVGDPLPGG
jgi:uncharacterized membrane protein